MTKLKVCGMTNPNNIRELSALHPDMMGFIFYEKSPRNASIAILETVVPELPASIKKVGVFVNASLSKVEETVAKLSLDAVQLHGEEDVAYCSALQTLGVEVIKVFLVENEFDFTQLEPYIACTNYFLFDTKGAKKGGNGVRFNWDVLNFYPYAHPYILSGGIGIAHAEELKKMNKEACVGVDVNSKFELEPGLKDIAQLDNFMEILNTTQYEL